MANNNQIYKFSNAGGFKSLNRYWDMLAGNTTWNPFTPQAGKWVLGTFTVPAGQTASSVVFAGIPSGYRRLQIRGTARVTGATTDSNYVAYFNNDTTAGNYPQHTIYGTGSGSAAAGYSPSDPNIAIGRCPGASSTSNMFGVGICDILDYASTNKNKTVRSLCGQDQNGSGIVLFNSGLWLSTAAITSITITAQSGNGNLAAGSTFSLYGIY